MREELLHQQRRSYSSSGGRPRSKVVRSDKAMAVSHNALYKLRLPFPRRSKVCTRSPGGLAKRCARA
jgi:hypothetical protein